MAAVLLALLSQHRIASRPIALTIVMAIRRAGGLRARAHPAGAQTVAVTLSDPDITLIRRPEDRPVSPFLTV